MTVPAPPLPDPTPLTQPFWDALRKHTIRIQYSPSADRYVFYPRAVTPGTLRDDLEWREISGAATLYTYAVTHRPTAPPWTDSVPQILAVLQWAEGPRFTTCIVDADPTKLRLGQAMEPVFADYEDDDVTLLFYRPRPDQAGSQLGAT